MPVFQLDLYGDVDERRSRATIEPGVVMVKIPKRENKAWPQLKAAGSAAEIKARRQAALEVKQLRDAKTLSDVKEKKRQDDDYVFHKQWDLEKDEKRTIERLAEIHKREAEESLNSWSDAAEGRKAPVAGKAEDSVSTYFDKQLVEGDLNPFHAKDGMVPLPGTYHKKTARTSAMEKSLIAEPDSAFDIRAKEGDDADKKAVLEKEKEKEMEEARKAREDAAAKEREADMKKAEEHKREEQERIMPLPLRERQQPKAEEEESAASVGPEVKKPEDMPVWKEASSDSEDGEWGGENKDEVEKEKEEEKGKPDVVKDEEMFLGRKKGASVNRWESEKVAEQHRQVADAYYKVGLVAEAKKHELQAREAAPWLDSDVRHYDTPEEAAERKTREEEERASRPEPSADLPAPRSAGKVELNFTMHRRNLPARERIETDEEVAKREEEDYKQKKMENPDKARAPTHDQAMWLKLRGDHFYRTRDYRAGEEDACACVQCACACGRAHCVECVWGVRGLGMRWCARLHRAISVCLGASILCGGRAGRSLTRDLPASYQRLHILPGARPPKRPGAHEPSGVLPSPPSVGGCRRRHHGKPNQTPEPDTLRLISSLSPMPCTPSHSEFGK